DRGDEGQQRGELARIRRRRVGAAGVVRDERQILRVRIRADAYGVDGRALGHGLVEVVLAGKRALKAAETRVRGAVREEEHEVLARREEIERVVHRRERIRELRAAPERRARHQGELADLAAGRIVEVGVYRAQHLGDVGAVDAVAVRLRWGRVDL